MHALLFIVLLSLIGTALSFTPRGVIAMNRLVVASKSQLFSENPAADNDPSAPKTKGFGTVKKAEKGDVVVEKDDGTKTYESQAKRGVPEYNIFLRPKNGTEGDWVPVGSMTIPRDTKVSKAVYEVEAELLKGTFKLYPKLKAFYDVRADKEGIFEYGFCLKAFPDEPIEVIVKEAAVAEQKNFFSNWLGKITNPLDTSDLKSKGQMTIKQ